MLQQHFPKEALDCEASADCRDKGNCKLIGSYCEPGEDAHCKQSNMCKAEGKCTPYEIAIQFLLLSIRCYKPMLFT